MSLDVDKTAEFLNRLSLFILISKYLNALIQSFKFITKGGIGQQIFVEMPHEIAMRLSHIRDSSTVLLDLLKFIKSSATDAVTIAAMVEMPRFLP